MSKKSEIEMTGYFDVLEDVKKCIANSQYRAMTSANVERNILYWHIGSDKVIIRVWKWFCFYGASISIKSRKQGIFY